MRPPDFFIRKIEKRKALEEFLPSDLGLIYGKAIKPHKWTFGGEMAERRSAKTGQKTGQDKIFFDALKKYGENALGGEEKNVPAR